MGCIPVITRTIFTIDSADLSYQYTFDVANSLSSIIVETLEPTQEQFVIKTLDVDLDGSGDYTIDTSTQIVTFVNLTKRGPVGTILQIRRCTQRERGVDINAENAFSPSTANRDQEQDFAFQQELETEFSDVMHKNDAGTEWNAEGLEVCNGAPATKGNCLVTLNQLNAAIFDGEVIDLNQPLVITLTGDGVTTAFSLPGARQTTPEHWFVYKNGVHQNSDSSSGGGAVYSISVVVGQDDQIVFTTAPEDEAVVICVILQGSVVSKLEDDSVTTDMIQDDAVTLDKINVGAGDADRFMVFDANGDPVARVAVHDDVSDFDAGVRENRLDQMAVPTANVAMNSRKITGMASGTVAGDAAIIDQLPNSPARIDDTNIANPGLDINVTTLVGFVVKHVAYTFRYRTTGGGVQLHATVHCVFEDTAQIWNEVMVTDNTGTPRAVLVRLNRNSTTGWTVRFNATAWNAIAGLHSGPQNVRALSYGDA